MRPSHRRHGDLAHGTFEGDCGDVVAFVDDDEPVAGGEFGEVGAPGEALDHRDVHDVAGAVTAAADLADLLAVSPRWLASWFRHCSTSGLRSTITRVGVA